MLQSVTGSELFIFKTRVFLETLHVHIYYYFRIFMNKAKSLKWKEYHFELIIGCFIIVIMPLKIHYVEKCLACLSG